MWNVLLSHYASIGLRQLPVVQFVEEACRDSRELSHGDIDLVKPLPVSVQ